VNRKPGFSDFLSRLTRRSSASALPSPAQRRTDAAPAARIPRASDGTSSDSIAFSIVIHLLCLILLLGSKVRLWDDPQETPPEVDVMTMDVTLSDAEDEGDAEGPAKQAPPGAPQPPAKSETPPALQVPQPPDPVPAASLPDKPSFDDALVPPTPDPTPAPTPVPAPVVKTTPVPQPSAPQPPSVAQKTSDHAAASSNGDAQQATLLPAGDGGGGGGSNGRVDAHPSLKRSIKPNYPIGARRRGEEGTIILDVTVTADGRASAVSLVSSCGFPELDSAAERAASEASFKPGLRNGKPVDSAARLTIIFRLRDQ
jgi:protein TonB